MFEDFTKRVRESIQRDMKEKFGLTEEESAQSAGIMLDKLRDFLSEARLRDNIGQLRQTIQEWTSDSSALRERFNRESLQELIDQVGLSEETAARVKDFSLERYLEQLRHSLSEKFDIQGLLGKFKAGQLEDSGRELLDQFNKFFQKNKP